MAEVYVNSWSEFVAAIGVAGDTVILPEEAEWDMNEILPDGNADFIISRCSKIDGRGTRIKNLHLNYHFEIAANSEILNLLMTDWIINTSGQDWQSNVFYVSSTSTIKLKNCAFSGILSAGTNKMFSNCAVEASKCAFNIEASNSGFMFCQYTSKLQYCRFEAHLPNRTSNATLISNASFCELVIYMSNSTGQFPAASYTGCTVRGNMQSKTTTGSGASWIGFPTVYLDGMFSDNFENNYGEYFIPCTEEQLKRPSYLREKGFPIVVGGD